MYIIRSKIKSLYNYLISRIDFVPVLYISFFLGIYIGGNISFSFIWFIFLFISICLISVYKIFIIKVLIFFLVGICFSIFSFNLSFQNSNIEGNLLYKDGETPVIEAHNYLWINKKFYISNKNIFFKQGENIQCNKFKISNVEKLKLEEGINQSVTCLEKWNVKDMDLFDNINTKLSNVFNDFSEYNKEFLKGITLGTKPSKELNIAFQRVGLSHILVISGYNITLLISCLSPFIKKFKPSKRIIIVSLFIFVFSLVVGFSAPVLRASLMGIIGYLALGYFPRISSIRLLVFVISLILFIDPYLIFSISLHLSVFATVGIILFSKLFTNIFQFIPFSQLRENISTTLGASFLTTVYNINVFSSLSISMLISNLIILPIVPILTIFSYIYIIFQNEILKYIITYISDITLRAVFYLSMFQNTYIILDEKGKNISIFVFLLFSIFAIVIFLNNKVKIYKRIEKKLIIK